MALSFAAALLATPAVGDPSIAAKQAEAQSVMGKVQQLAWSLERVIQAYALATVNRIRVQAHYKANHAHLQIAKQSLSHAQSALSARLVSLYTSNGQSDSLEVLLGASSLDDLVNRFNTANRISSQDTQVLAQVAHFDNEVKAREVRLKHAKAEAAALVRERASERASIQGQLSTRRALLSSIRGQIAQLQAQEAARQAQLRRELAARIVTQQQQAPAQALSSPAAPVVSSGPSSSPGGSAPEGPPPPSPPAAFSGRDRFAAVGLSGRTGKSRHGLQSASQATPQVGARRILLLTRVKAFDLVGEALLDHAALELQGRRHLALLRAELS